MRGFHAALTGLNYAGHRHGMSVGLGISATRPTYHLMRPQYEAMNIEQIDNAAAEVLRPHQLIWLIVGDLSKIEEPIRALGIGDVEILEL